jgi:hypothetical protein
VSTGGEIERFPRLQWIFAAINDHSSATGNWQLATGNWQLATGNWQLATDN